MILRRLSAELRTQNWTTIAIELAIVILGVFIGTQVSNWNNVRLERAKTEQMARDLWASSMDEARREKLGLGPLKPLLQKVDAIKTKKDLQEFLAWGHRTGLGFLWGVHVGRDDKNSDKNSLFFHQDGLSLPDRDYYLNDDAESKRGTRQFPNQPALRDVLHEVACA